MEYVVSDCGTDGLKQLTAVCFCFPKTIEKSALNHRLKMAAGRVVLEMCEWAGAGFSCLSSGRVLSLSVQQPTLWQPLAQGMIPRQTVRSP